MTDELRGAAQAAQIALSAISTHPTLTLSDFMRGKVDEAARGLRVALAAEDTVPRQQFDDVLAAERALSAAYVRLRLILGAMDPPSTDARALWAYVEGVARERIAAQPAAAEPVFFYRPCGDGLYEGPVHAKSVGGKLLRDEKPGEWVPLYAGAAPAQTAKPVAFDAQGFRAWVARNLPDDTIIGSGAWWADHLTAWAQRFVKAGAVPAQPVAAAPIAHIKGPAADRLTPLDAVYRAMDMASILAGAVARSDAHGAAGCAARLKSHLVKYICDAQPVAAPPAREPLTADQVWQSADIMACNADAGLLMPDLLAMVRAVERAHGIGIGTAPASQQPLTFEQMEAIRSDQRSLCAAAVRATPTHTWVDGSDQGGNPMNVKVMATREDYAKACERAPSIGTAPAAPSTGDNA